MILLSKEAVIVVHEEVIADTGGDNGLRDEGLLEAAIHAPFQTYDGEDLFPSLTEKAARLAYGIIKNHPFVDGNKRTGTALMLLFLELNGVTLFFDHQDLIDTILDVAAGEINYEKLAEWIRNSQL